MAGLARSFCLNFSQSNSTVINIYALYLSSFDGLFVSYGTVLSVQHMLLHIGLVALNIFCIGKQESCKQLLLGLGMPTIFWEFDVHNF